MSLRPPATPGSLAKRVHETTSAHESSLGKTDPLRFFDACCSRQRRCRSRFFLRPRSLRAYFLFARRKLSRRAKSRHLMLQYTRPRSQLEHRYRILLQPRPRHTTSRNSNVALPLTTSWLDNRAHLCKNSRIQRGSSCQGGPIARAWANRPSLLFRQVYATQELSDS